MVLITVDNYLTVFWKKQIVNASNVYYVRTLVRNVYFSAVKFINN